MNPRIRYVTVGLFVLSGAALFVMVAFWIGDGGMGRQTRGVQMIFEDSVVGLTEGSPVRFMGVEVGRVRSIELLTDGAPAVRVVADLAETTPRGRDVRASLAFEGITGVTYVNLESRPQLPAKTRGRGELPEIATASGNLRALMDDLPALADRADQLLERAGRLLSPENLSRVETSLAAVAELTEAAAGQRATVERTLTDAAAAVAELKTAASAIAATASEARAPVSRSVTELADAAARVSSITSGPIACSIATNRISTGFSTGDCRPWDQCWKNCGIRSGRCRTSPHPSRRTLLSCCTGRNRMPSSSSHEFVPQRLRRRYAETAAALLLLLSGGCALDLEREGPPSRTYWLEPAEVHGSAGSSGAAAPRRNVSVTAVPGLDTDQILALEPSGQLIPFAGGHWQARIPVLMESLLARSLSPGDGARLRVDVRRFFVEQRAGAADGAVIELVVWQANDRQRAERFNARTPVRASRLEAIVAAFEQSFAEVAAELGAWLE